MDIEKIVVPINGEQYSFSVEVMKDEDETIYRVTPDQNERILEDVSPGYLEFDGKGNLQVDERAMNKQGKEVTGAIWEAIKDKQNQPDIKEGTNNRADYHHGSTVQGGSNYGQGSLQLGKNADHEGSESNNGANYENEKGWNSEALRIEDI